MVAGMTETSNRHDVTITAGRDGGHLPNLAVFARSSGLPDVEAGDGAADDHALDLRGALEDGEVVRRSYPRLGLTFEIRCLNLRYVDDG
jgi:hypothetical protein